MSKKTGQQELDEYIFTRPEMARLLGISTNALRMRMRKGRCNLDYRFNGKQFLFKRPLKERVQSKMLDQPRTRQNKKFKKKYNRGNTHKGKGKYENEAFKLHNQMKIMNTIQGKFKSEAHRREFEKLNEEGLKIAQDNLRKKAEKSLGSLQGRPKYGGMIRGYSKPFYELPYEINKEPPPSGSFHIGGKPYSEFEKKEEDIVEVDLRDFPPDDKEPTFSSKVEENIWRLKNKK